MKILTIYPLLFTALVSGSINSGNSSPILPNTNIEIQKSTNSINGDNGVYKGYVEQKSRGTIPPIVITTTNSTTNYNYVPPPPPPAPAGVTPEATASGVRFYIMSWIVPFGNGKAKVLSTDYCDTWTNTFYNQVPDADEYRPASGSIKLTAKKSGNVYNFTGNGYYTPAIAALVATYGGSANPDDF